MAKLKSKIFVALVFLALAPSRALAVETLRIGAIPIADHLPLHAGIYQGFFDEQGIKLNVEFMAGGGVILPALIGGSLDLGDSAYTQLFMARDQGFELVILAPYGRLVPGVKEDASSMVVVSDSPIKTAKDLEGKKIAVVTLKSPNWLYGYEWMAQKGADPKKAEWLELPFPQQFPALRGGKVDAVSGTEPFVTLEQERGGVRIIGYPFMEVDPKMEVSGVMAPESWAKAKPELVERFTRAFKKAIDYVRANPDKRAEMVARYTRLNPDVVAKMKMHEAHFPIDVESLQAHSDLALKWGLIRKKQEVRRFIWPTALK